MEPNEELKFLIEQNARHLAHLQRRIDILQGIAEAQVQLLLAAATQKFPPDSDERKMLAQALLSAYATARDAKIAKLSEFPFLGENMPDEPT